MLWGSEIWSVKEDNVIRLEKNDASIVALMCNSRVYDVCPET